jgi:hypothetical protein
MGKGKRLEIVILFYSRNAVGSPNLARIPSTTGKDKAVFFAFCRFYLSLAGQLLSIDEALIFHCVVNLITTPTSGFLNRIIS